MAIAHLLPEISKDRDVFIETGTKTGDITRCARRTWLTAIGR